VRAKTENVDIEYPDNETIPNEVEVIDALKDQPKKVPFLIWNDCINNCLTTL
jgi:hypothetical protein